MKKLFAFLLIFILASCQSHKVFEDYELSYSRSGGYAPAYENLLIKGNTANYFFEGRGKKYSQKVKISDAEKQQLYNAIEQNKLASVREDHKKLYDFVSTTVKVKKTGTLKSDGSGIIPAYQQEWDNIVAEFESFIKSKNLRK